MPRPEKVQAVAEIKERFEGAGAVFVTEYRGLPVKAMGDLRRRLRDAGADYQVVKMTLAKRAVDDLGIDELSESLVGPTALAFANEDPVGVAKALSDYSKTNESLVVKLGLLSGKILSPEDIAKLAEIEPREVLLAKLAGAARAPLQAMAGMLSSFTRDTASMLSQLLDKKEADPADAAAPPPEAAGDGIDHAAATAPDPAPDPTDTDDDPTAAVEGSGDVADVPDPAPDPTDTDDDPTAGAEGSGDEAEEE